MVKGVDANHGWAKHSFQLVPDLALHFDGKFCGLCVDARGKYFNCDIEQTILDLASDCAEIPDCAIPRSTPVTDLHQEDNVLARKLLSRCKVKKWSRICG